MLNVIFYYFILDIKIYIRITIYYVMKNRGMYTRQEGDEVAGIE